jgi:ATP-dependent Clp protease ATP-binding subunit ClpA
MFEVFTETSIRVLSAAIEHAIECQCPVCGTEFILIGFLGLQLGLLDKSLSLDLLFEVCAEALDKTDNPVTIGSGISRCSSDRASKQTRAGVFARARADAFVNKPRNKNLSPQKDIPFSNETSLILYRASSMSKELGFGYVAVEHLLLTFSRAWLGLGADILNNWGINKKVLERDIIKELKTLSEPRDVEIYFSGDPVYLKGVGTIMNAEAENGVYDPVIGRDEEIDRSIIILSRRTKNNPVLLGEAGVGKTALVEGLAQRIVDGKVPDSLAETTLISLDHSALLAGTKWRGEFEQKVRWLLRDAKYGTRIDSWTGTRRILNKRERRAEENSKESKIYFIDEAHTFVGRAGNLLKPALSRGEFVCIGATTSDEFAKYFEADGALARRFQSVMVVEPSLAATREILLNLRFHYEKYHNLSILDEAIDGAVNLSNEYIKYRNMPDKAIDVLDEACARVKLNLRKYSTEILKIQEDIATLSDKRRKAHLAVLREESLAQRIANGKGPNSLAEENLKKLSYDEVVFPELIDEAQLNLQAKEESSSTNVKFKEEKDAKKKKYERFLEEEAIMKFQFESLLKKWNIDQDLSNEVSLETIAKVVSEWTSAEISDLSTGRINKVKGSEDQIRNSVVGQKIAVMVLTKALRRARLGFTDPKRPIASIALLGPTGVGKTELANSTARYFYGSEDFQCRLDMSEYYEPHSVGKLIGAPPGYQGWDEGGFLTNAVRQNPSSMVLLDEIEKAHRRVFDLLLSILEDGILVDGKGRLANFCKNLIIMTSNVGAEIQSNGKFRATSFDTLPSDSEQGWGSVQTQMVAKSSKDEFHKREFDKSFGSITSDGQLVKRIWNSVYEKHLEWATFKMGKIFRPEFINRLDSVVLLGYLDCVDVKKVCEYKISDQKKEIYERQAIKFGADERLYIKCGALGFDSEYGARPVKRVITKLVIDGVNKFLLRGLISEEQDCYLLGTSSPTKRECRFGRGQQYWNCEKKPIRYDKNRVKLGGKFILIRHCNLLNGRVKDSSKLPKGWSGRYYLW